MCFIQASAAILAFGHLGIHAAEVWDNPEGGIFIISVSETKINWGSIDPVSVIDKLKGEGCHATFCDDVEDSTSYVSDGKSEIGSIEIEVKDSTFNDNSPGTMNDMLEVLHKIVFNGNFVKS